MRNRDGGAVASTLRAAMLTSAPAGRYERTPAGEADFHRKSLITQKWAELLAGEFNKQAEALGLSGLPTISYMTCCYVRTQRASPASHEAHAADETPERLLFAERMIEGQFRKWNTNFVHASRYELPIDTANDP